MDRSDSLIKFFCNFTSFCGECKYAIKHTLLEYHKCYKANKCIELKSKIKSTN